MSPDEIEKTRKDLGCTTLQFASLIGVTDRTVRRYETGDREVPGSVERIAKLALAMPAARQWLENYPGDESKPEN